MEYCLLHTAAGRLGKSSLRHLHAVSSLTATVHVFTFPKRLRFYRYMSCFKLYYSQRLSAEGVN